MGHETITAISTPPGVGAVGIVRIVGPQAFNIADEVFRGRSLPSTWPSHTVHFGILVDARNNEQIDQVLVTAMRAPNSYTGLDTVEINCHGGILNMSRILGVVLALGARHAEPGEFTKLAFLSGKMDLAKVEAVADLIHAKTEAARRASAGQFMGNLSETVRDLRNQALHLCGLIELDLDFGEENLLQVDPAKVTHEIREMTAKLQSLAATYSSGHLLREGAKVAIVGKPNAGKSSLLNALLSRYRAIVSDIPGTTRDFIEETLDLDGIPVTFVDTAGLRSTHDPVETEGIRLSLDHMASADLIIAVFDNSRDIDDDDRRLEQDLIRIQTEAATTRVIRVANKKDLPDYKSNGHLAISAKTGEGIPELKKLLADMLNVHYSFESPIVMRDRHKTAIDSAIKSLDGAMKTCTNEMSYEFVAVDIRKAIADLGEIIGEVAREDVINKIFSGFCIGK